MSESVGAANGNAITSVTSSAASTVEASMKGIPKTEHVLVLRTDFSDDSAWKSICAVVQEAMGEFRDRVNCLSDSEYDGLTVEQVTASLAPLLAGERKPFEYQESFMFIVDRIALTHPDHPILVVDLCDEGGRTFRVIPSEIRDVEINLWLGNLDFDDFADHVEEDGIFRGIPKS